MVFLPRDSAHFSGALLLGAVLGAVAVLLLRGNTEAPGLLGSLRSGG